MVWNERQLDFINQPLGPGRLLGVPGGGKTKCLLGRVIRLIDDEIIHPRGFIVLAFSKLAVADFLRKGRELRSGVFDEWNVRTIHSLSGTIVSKLLDRNGDWSINTVVNRARLEIEKTTSDVIRDQIWSLKHVGSVFVDEAQDMSSVQYDFSVALSSKLSAPLCLVGDPNQSIYQFQGGSDRFLREHQGFSVSLTNNYRSTPSICSISEACKPVSGDSIVSASGNTGPAPEFFCDHQKQIVADVAKKTVSALASGMTVGIIGPIRKSREEHGHYFNLGLSMITAEFHKRGIPYLIHYKEDSDSEGDVDGQRGGDPTSAGVAHLLTCHGSKGLEYDVVMLLNYHTRAMGRIPPPKDIGALQCLWYVGLSRARTEMTIYCDMDKAVWPGYDKIHMHLKRSRREPKRHSAPAKESPEKLAFGWTELLKDPVMMDEEKLTELEDAMRVSIDEILDGDPMDIDETEDLPLPDEGQLSSLYGMWAENTHAHHYRGAAPPVLERVESMLEATVIPSELNSHVRILWRVLALRPGSPLRWACFDGHRQSLTGTTVSPLVDFLDSKRPDPPTPEYLNVRCVSDLRWWDEAQVRSLVRRARTEMRSCRVTLETMWRLCLLEWQHDCECGYRWDMDDAVVINALRPHHNRIAMIAAGEQDGLRLQVPGSFPHLPVHGIADVVHAEDKRIIELKFCRTVDVRHAMQATGYAEMLGGRNPHEWNVEIHNLRTGKMYQVKNALHDRKARWNTLCVLSRATGLPLSDTAWLYDLETTGLNTDKCGLLEVHLEEYSSGVVPVSSLVHQTEVPAKVVEITGITEEMIKNAPLEKDVISEFRKALSACSSPKLLAHNGHRFDHAIMQRHGALPKNVRLVDTMHLFPLSAMPKRVKGERKRLQTIYESVLGKPFSGTAHRASADVAMMREVMDVSGFMGHSEAVL